MSESCMLNCRQKTNLLKFTMFLLMAFTIGLLYYTGWKCNETIRLAEGKCVPGMVEKIHDNQVLCTTGEKRWVTNIR